MKKIIIKGEEFYYSVDRSGNYTATKFYKKVKRKFLWFSWIWFNHEFTVNFDIEDPYYSKEEMKKSVEKDFYYYLKQKERQSEIDKGEVI